CAAYLIRSRWRRRADTRCSSGRGLSASLRSRPRFSIQRTGVSCQSRPNAPQQKEHLLDHLVGAGEQAKHLDGVICTRTRKGESGESNDGRLNRGSGVANVTLSFLKKRIRT